MTIQTPAARTAALALAPFTAAALVLAPSPAGAHDVLTGSTPEDGQTLDTAPEEVVLSFNNAPLESGDGNAISVTGPDEETTYETGDLVFEGNDVSTELEPLDQAGDYTIGFRVVSSDGHPIQESLTFTVPEEAVAEGASEEEEGAGADEAAAEDTQDEGAQEDTGEAAEETATEEAADEGGISGTAVGIIIAAAVVVLAGVILVAVRVRRSTH
ncbi:copper resistance CopC family protein [Nocardiopsis kunsanensis]|uniref:copper resistance CopC family protein n=1 Tax=Nocardiopsis kunsanensis TaxID=141693 RepID=UPI000348E884|nr:copper resistance CopC family protein [Nocardiopsis kunsanensis]